MRTNEPSEKEMERLRAKSERERLKFVGTNEPDHNRPFDEDNGCFPPKEAHTPDTDEAQFGTGRVSVDFARRLERERDANAADLAALRLAVAGVASELAKSAKWAHDMDERECDDVLLAGLIDDCDDLAERLAAALRGCDQEMPRIAPRIDSGKTSPSGRVETAESASDASQGLTGGKNE